MSVQSSSTSGVGSGCLFYRSLKQVEAGSGTSPEELLLLCSHRSHLALSDFPSRSLGIQMSGFCCALGWKAEKLDRETAQRNALWGCIRGRGALCAWTTCLLLQPLDFFHSLMSSGINRYCANVVYGRGWHWSRVWPCKPRACLWWARENGRNMSTCGISLWIHMVKQKCNKRRKRCFCASIVQSECIVCGGSIVEWLWQWSCSALWYICVCTESCSTTQDTQLSLTWHRSVEGCCWKWEWLLEDLAGNLGSI